MNKLLYVVSLFCAFMGITIHGEGFIGSTLVKTPGGYTPIEEIKVNDTVICYDFEGACVERSVTNIVKKPTKVCTKITLDGQEVYTAPDHLFYLPNQKSWLAASQLTVEHGLLQRCTEIIYLEGVEEVSLETELYDITVAGYHNFCVTTSDVHVHNFAPAVLLGIAYVWGGGFAAYGGVAFGGFLLGTIGYQAFKGGSEKRNYYRRVEAEDDYYAPEENGFCVNCQFPQGKSVKDDYYHDKQQRGSGKKQKAPSPDAASGGGQPPEDPNKNRKGSRVPQPPKEPDKERKINDIPKSEFFKNEDIKQSYEHWQDGTYKLRRGAQPIVKGGEFLKWDHLHNDVEVYNKAGSHLGSLNPRNLRLYKERVVGRRL